jgi:hypothetical protein
VEVVKKSKIEVKPLYSESAFLRQHCATGAFRLYRGAS